MAVYKLKHFKNRYAVINRFYVSTPNFGFNLADAKLADKLGKRIVDDKAKIDSLFDKAKKQDKRYD